MTLGQAEKALREAYSAVEAALWRKIDSQLESFSRRHPGRECHFDCGMGVWQVYLFDDDPTKYREPRELPCFRELERFVSDHGWNVIPTGHAKAKNGKIIESDSQSVGKQTL